MVIKHIHKMQMGCKISPSPFGVKYINMWEINVDRFRFHYSLNFPPNAVLCFCLLFLLYLSSFCIIFNNSKPHTSTLERLNFIEAGLQQMQSNVACSADGATRCDLECMTDIWMHVWFVVQGKCEGPWNEYYTTGLVVRLESSEIDHNR